jgi:hypothetical protein
VANVSRPNPRRVILVEECCIVLTPYHMHGIETLMILSPGEAFPVVMNSVSILKRGQSLTPGLRRPARAPLARARIQALSPAMSEAGGRFAPAGHLAA